MKGDQILNESIKQNFVWIGWSDVAENENTMNMLIHKKGSNKPAVTLFSLTSGRGSLLLSIETHV